MPQGHFYLVIKTIKRYVLIDVCGFPSSGVRGVRPPAVQHVVKMTAIDSRCLDVVAFLGLLLFLLIFERL